MKRSRKPIPTLLLSFTALLALAGTLSAAIINVPGDFLTIQGAIADVGTANGDEIVVAAGTYNEAIDFLGKAITLRSASGDPADTIIDGDGANHVVQCISGEGPLTVLEGFTITGGNANGSDNDARGGGMYIEGSSPTVTNCTFIRNLASFGAGMANTISSNPTVTNCTFSGNTAGFDGGGMYNDDYSSPTVTNCTFSGNGGDPYIGNGGGMVNVDSSPTITNCTFSGNNGGDHSIGNGGGMYNVESSPMITNCIFWGNLDSGGMDESGQIHTESGTPLVTYSDVQGSWTGAGGTGNISADPLFVDANGADDTFGTEDDDPRLQPGSPCIDAGDNTPIPAGITTDLDGNPRISHLTVDMGAYEFQDDDGDGVPDSSDLCPGFDDALDTDSDGVTDGCDLCPGFDDSGPDGDGDGIPDDCDTPTVHNLTQGTDHFTLQAAIFDAGSGHEIVADPATYNESIYFIGTEIILRSASGDPNDTIIDGNGAATVVRFGNGETSSTVLEGFTITGGDGSFDNGLGGGLLCTSNSSPTVRNCIFSNNTANLGGGMFNELGSSPTVSYCTFSGNNADVGGGMANFNNSNPEVIDCRFSGNTANYRGGGMANFESSSPAVTGCTFSGNTTIENGGGMSNQNNSSPRVNDCIFNDNTANLGGGMYNENSSNPTVADCTFNDNTANSSGGGMSNSDCDPTVINGTFTNNTAVAGGGMFNELGSDAMVSNSRFLGNSADFDGGGMANLDSSPTVIYCRFSGNTTVGNGGGLANMSNSSPAVSYCTFSGNSSGMFDDGFNSTKVFNCIFWDNTNFQLIFGGSDPVNGNKQIVSFSDVQNDLPFINAIDGGGNIDADPLFVDANGADGMFGTDDDDLHLQPGSPAIDAAAGPPGLDDMGAFQFSTNPCPLEGDINCDGIVNLLDQALLAAGWLETI